MKKTIKRICAILLTLSLCLAGGIFGNAETYWDVQRDYNAAVASGNGAQIIACVKRLEAVYANPSDMDEYMRLAGPFEHAALEYEKLTQYAEANEYYGKSYACYEWLDKNGLDFRDKLQCLNAIMSHLSDHFELFTEASLPISNPYHEAINEPVNGTRFGSCNVHPGEESGHLVYVQFYSENIYDFAWLLPNEYESKLIEVAWNVPNENLSDLQGVTKSSNWDYIKRNVDWLSEQDYSFLLRFGAEVNCWADLDNHTKEENTKAFKDAFILIADYVHEVAPNVAMVFSPNEISNWYYDADDFYPGDEYVDWVGLSSYNNYSASVSNGIGSQTDAWYSRGVYENQIERIRSIVEKYGDRKPIIISECGFCYASSGSTQTVEHAVDSLRFFYTYVNMVYPQVKAIYYFNTNFGGNQYKLSGNDQVLSAYEQTLKANVSMQATIGGAQKYYTSLDSFSESAKSLNIYAYAYKPGCKATVTYTLDGKTLQESNRYPYQYTLSSLSEGVHVLEAKAVYGKTAEIRNYGIYVGKDGKISTVVSKMKDLDFSRWYYEPIAYGMHRGLFNGLSADTFSPNGSMTRGMLVTVLYRMEASPELTDEKIPFTDVPEGKYYSDAVKWAAQNDIVKGLSAASFAPNNQITREQIATILYRYAEYLGEDPTERTEISNRPDASEVHEYAEDAIAWAVATGIIQGDEKGRLTPRAAATRAHMAKMLMSLCEYYNK